MVKLNETLQQLCIDKIALKIIISFRGFDIRHFSLKAFNLLSHFFRLV